MKFLGRESKQTSPDTELTEQLVDEAEQASGAYTPSKGRATPKRREAEGKRRGPVAPPPKTQREALKRMRGNKEERRKASADRRERIMRGDDSALLPRDRGPVKAFVRDLVDARRNLSGAFMPVALLALPVVFLGGKYLIITQYISYVFFVMMLIVVIEGLFLSKMVVRRVREKFPDAKDRGFSLGWYATMRAMQYRRLRAPRARVKHGAVIS
ncbi:DUF3043 domain-containing protein [Pseudonocardiaceae bacterium YIM PH 21723]|nr:DUF3043 domain-containing protein [Pseudonocardiaceae bacterium YIM PH 21723]